MIELTISDRLRIPMFKELLKSPLKKIIVINEFLDRFSDVYDSLGSLLNGALNHHDQ